jgi:hypothetical protein
MKAKDDELRPEYPAALIKKGVRGKYAKRYRESTNVVRIDDDLGYHVSANGRTSA